MLSADQVDDLRVRASGAAARADRLERQSRASSLLVMRAEVDRVAEPGEIDKARRAAIDLAAQARSARRDAEALASEAGEAFAAYLRRWQSGMPAPFGYQECRGRRPDGSDGPHLRRVVEVRREIYALASGGGVYPEPYPVTVELAENERAEFTVADPRPFIIEVPPWL